MTETKCPRCWKNNPWVHTYTPLTEHEKLKWICDKIWYETYFKNWTLYWVDDKTHYFWNVRELIFTPEFWEKFENYAYDNIWWIWTIRIDIFNNLDNPIWYLYNLIK